VSFDNADGILVIEKDAGIEILPTEVENLLLAGSGVGCRSMVTGR